MSGVYKHTLKAARNRAKRGDAEQCVADGLLKDIAAQAGKTELHIHCAMAVEELRKEGFNYHPETLRSLCRQIKERVVTLHRAPSRAEPDIREATPEEEAAAGERLRDALAALEDARQGLIAAQTGSERTKYRELIAVAERDVRLARLAMDDMQAPPPYKHVPDRPKPMNRMLLVSELSLKAAQAGILIDELMTLITRYPKLSLDELDGGVIIEHLIQTQAKTHDALQYVRDRTAKSRSRLSVVGGTQYHEHEHSADIKPYSRPAPKHKGPA